MHLGDNLMLSLIEYFFVVNFVEMLQVYFVFVCDDVVNETVFFTIIFGDWWRHVLYF